MKRREFITLIGGAAAAWPLAARAQQPAMPMVGFLNTASAETSLGSTAGFIEGIGTIGYVEGRNVAIEYRWADGRYDRLPALAADFVRRQVNVIFAGAPPAARAAKIATTTIPIVFTSGEDPVAAGLVTSLNQPGGNVTGVSLLSSALEAKRFGLIREVLPNATTMAVLLNSNYPGAATQTKAVQEAAQSIGQRILILNASTEAEIDGAFAAMAREKVGGLLVCSDPYISARREEVVLLAARHAIRRSTNGANSPRLAG